MNIKIKILAFTCLFYVSPSSWATSYVYENGALTGVIGLIFNCYSYNVLFGDGPGAGGTGGWWPPDSTLPFDTSADALAALDALHTYFNDNPILPSAVPNGLNGAPDAGTPNVAFEIAVPWDQFNKTDTYTEYNIVSDQYRSTDELLFVRTGASLTRRTTLNINDDPGLTWANFVQVEYVCDEPPVFLLLAMGAIGFYSRKIRRPFTIPL